MEGVVAMMDVVMVVVLMVLAMMKVELMVSVMIMTATEGWTEGLQQRHRGGFYRFRALFWLILSMSGASLAHSVDFGRYSGGFCRIRSNSARPFAGGRHVMEGMRGVAARRDWQLRWGL